MLLWEMQVPPASAFKIWDRNSVTRELHNLPHRFSSFIFRETMLSKVCCFHFQCYCVWFDVWGVTQVLVLKIVQGLPAVGSLHQTHLPANQQGHSHLLPAGFSDQEQEFLRIFRLMNVLWCNFSVCYWLYVVTLWLNLRTSASSSTVLLHTSSPTPQHRCSPV